jgi:hypothetical protein
VWTRRQDPSGEENIEVGSDGSCTEAGLAKLVSGRIIRERGNPYLNCSVTKEKMRACAVESTKTISSFPHTKAA